MTRRRTPPRRRHLARTAGNGKDLGPLSRHADRAAVFSERASTSECRRRRFQLCGNELHRRAGIRRSCERSDLWQSPRPFPAFAPLYTQSRSKPESLRLLMVAARSAGASVPAETDSPDAIGESVDSVDAGAPTSSATSSCSRRTTNSSAAPSTRDGTADEATLSSGDSGGAAFIEDNASENSQGSTTLSTAPFLRSTHRATAASTARSSTPRLFSFRRRLPAAYTSSPATRPCPQRFTRARLLQARLALQRHRTH